jgi:hypothetical protein
MSSPALLVFLAPLATAVLVFIGGSRLFEKSIDSDRLRDIIAYMAALMVGSFAVIMAALFSWYAYTQLA